MRELENEPKNVSSVLEKLNHDRLLDQQSSKKNYSAKNTSKQFNSTLKGLYTMTKWDIFLECKENLTNETIIIVHINRMMEKKHVIISIDAEKACDKI